MSNVDLQRLLSPKGAGVRIAVLGASNDAAKYGNIIVRNLTGHGYTVLPVNPKEATIAGLKAYATVGDVPRPVHVVNFVTPPAVSTRLVAECAAAGLSNLWFQEGSFDEATLAAARAARTPAGVPMAIESGACIMVVAARTR